MIEISFGKLVLLALIALIVLGPEKLPKAARTAGTLLRRVRSGWDSVRAEVERELQIEEIRREAREAAARAEAAQKELDDAVRRTREFGDRDVREALMAPPATDHTVQASMPDASATSEVAMEADDASAIGSAAKPANAPVASQFPSADSADEPAPTAAADPAEASVTAAPRADGVDTAPRKEPPYGDT